MGKRRETVRVVVSLACVAATAYLAFAWYERVRSDGRSGVDLEKYSYCADVFRAGSRTIPSPEEPVPCYSKAGDVTVVVTKVYHCDDGTTLFANRYDWWSTEEPIVKVPTDRGTPPRLAERGKTPRAALDHCLGR